MIRRKFESSLWIKDVYVPDNTLLNNNDDGSTE